MKDGAPPGGGGRGDTAGFLVHVPNVSFLFCRDGRRKQRAHFSKCTTRDAPHTFARQPKQPNPVMTSIKIDGGFGWQTVQNLSSRFQDPPPFSFKGQLAFAKSLRPFIFTKSNEQHARNADFHPDYLTQCKRGRALFE